ncbi:MAG: hypothetical protein JXN59_16025 [Anaerolineae bacterium]|nr:hypothetical protein [Anaerolineae bacterium]
MNRRVVVVLALVVAGLGLLAGCEAVNARVIGTVSGVENERITIGKTAYVLFDDPFTSADRGRYLGNASNGRLTYRVYAVKGDDAQRTLYAVSGYDGAFFIREDLPGR